ILIPTAPGTPDGSTHCFEAGFRGGHRQTRTVATSQPRCPWHHSPRAAMSPVSIVTLRSLPGGGYGTGHSGLRLAWFRGRADPPTGPLRSTHDLVGSYGASSGIDTGVRRPPGS